MLCKLIILDVWSIHRNKELQMEIGLGKRVAEFKSLGVLTEIISPIMFSLSVDEDYFML